MSGPARPPAASANQRRCERKCSPGRASSPTSTWLVALGCTRQPTPRVQVMTAAGEDSVAAIATNGDAPERRNPSRAAYTAIVAWFTERFALDLAVSSARLGETGHMTWTATTSASSSSVRASSVRHANERRGDGASLRFPGAMGACQQVAVWPARLSSNTIRDGVVGAAVVGRCVGRVGVGGRIGGVVQHRACNPTVESGTRWPCASAEVRGNGTAPMRRRYGMS
jgi:hypothetical protein